MARFDAESIQKALDFIFANGSQQDKDDYSSLIANVNRYRLQREDLLEGRADPYVNGHHPIADLEGGGTTWKKSIGC